MKEEKSLLAENFNVIKRRKQQQKLFNWSNMCDVCTCFWCDIYYWKEEFHVCCQTDKKEKGKFEENKQAKKTRQNQYEN